MSKYSAPSIKPGKDIDQEVASPSPDDFLYTTMAKALHTSVASTENDRGHRVTRLDPHLRMSHGSGGAPFNPCT